MMIDGAFLIDKPSGISSHGVVARVRRKLGIKKVGHAGTLDPLATGLLVVLCGRATRLQSIFLDADKSYSGIFFLGRETSTDDLEGEVLNSDDDFSLAGLGELNSTIESIRAEFLGEQEQIPPQFSAIKVAGRPSYKLARAGGSTKLKGRAIRINRIDLHAIDNVRLKYFVSCSKGTYIRSLARDIGRFLGTFGMLESIRREYSTPFYLENATALDVFMDIDNPLDKLVSMEQLVKRLPQEVCSREQLKLLKNGVQSQLATLKSKGEPGDLLALFSKNGDFSGLLECQSSGSWRVRFLM